MAAKMDPFKPSVTNWFSTPVEYSGSGRAEFVDPPGTIEGTTRVQFDEYGNGQIEMKVEKMEPDSNEPMRALLFLRGSPPVATDGKVTRGIAGRENPCTTLTVTCKQGTLFTEKPLISRLNSSVTHQDREQLVFRSFRSSWDVKEARSPQYWVLPVTNFLAEFGAGDDRLDSHPLRIRRPTALPSNLSREKVILARWAARWASPVIVFQFNDALGFIEPLPDYKERQKKLVEGQERQLVTALMVGDIGAYGIHFPTLESWFPFDFLSLLEVATGSEVSTPWIEFRDAAGELVSRKHMRLGVPAYSRGHRAIREDIHGGIGRLLTCSPKSDHWNKPYLRVALSHLIKGGLSGLSVEDSLSHLCRGVDALCDGLGLKKAARLESLLGEDSCHTLEATLAAAQKSIRKLAEEIHTQGRDGEAATLKRVADRIGKSANVEAGFGKTVVTLLEKFHLPDAGIMARHYASNPRRDGCDWPTAISKYRGISTHRGYFDFRSGDVDFDDVIAVYKHLHDILLRILFKLLGYDGTYQPTVEIYTTQARLDWVTPETGADKLGY